MLSRKIKQTHVLESGGGKGMTSVEGILREASPIGSIRTKVYVTRSQVGILDRADDLGPIYFPLPVPPPGSGCTCCITAFPQSCLPHQTEPRAQELVFLI